MSRLGDVVDDFEEMSARKAWLIFAVAMIPIMVALYFGVTKWEAWDNQRMTDKAEECERSGGRAEIDRDDLHCIRP